MKSNSEINFRKKASDTINIPGTRVSLKNAQLLTSTGSSTLDFFLGGGLAIGTICLIEEDRYNSYTTVLLKYFIAEGVVNNHAIYFASGDKDPKTFLKELPEAKTVESACSPKFPVDKSNENLEIAWRYKNKTMEDVLKVESHNIGFDLSKTMADEKLNKCCLATWDPSEVIGEGASTQHNILQAPYSSLYKSIKNEIESKGFRTSSKAAENVLRIGINSIASPLWQCTNKETHFLSLVRFLYMLKALLRSSFAVAVVTVPSFLLTNSVLLSRMHQMCDTVINLESFVGSDKKSNPLFKDFDGLLHIKKLPVLNSFTYLNITSDLAFKLKRKGFLIERLHLPPDLEDQSQDQPVQMGCSAIGSKLDF